MNFELKWRLFIRSLKNEQKSKWKICTHYTFFKWLKMFNVHQSHSSKTKVYFLFIKWPMGWFIEILNWKTKSFNSFLISGIIIMIDSKIPNWMAQNDQKNTSFQGTGNEDIELHKKTWKALANERSNKKKRTTNLFKMWNKENCNYTLYTVHRIPCYFVIWFFLFFLVSVYSLVQGNWAISNGNTNNVNNQT